MPDDIRWGILGAADIAGSLIPAIHRACGATLAAIASRSAGKAQRWAEEHGIRHAFGSYEALLESGAVDAVYLPLPNALHATWTHRALAAGLPVLCEKPLAPTAEEARAVAAATEQYGLPVMEAFMYRFHPQWDLVRAILADGAIGDVVTVSGTFTFLLDDPDSIVASAEMGGGALLDVGCYPVNLMRWLLGCEPTRVSAFARWSGVDETMVGILDFPNGVLGRFETSIGAAEHHHVAIRGTLATLEVPSPWHPSTEGREVRILRHDTPPERIAVRHELPLDTDTYQLEVEHFGALVRGTVVDPLIPLADSIADKVVLDALALSAREGRVVTLDDRGEDHPRAD